MIVRTLTERDRDAVLNFLDRDHETNLVMIYDIETFGIENLGHLFQGDYHGCFLDEELRGVACLYNLGSLWIHAPGKKAAAELGRSMAGLNIMPRYLIARKDQAVPVLAALRKQGVRPDSVEEQKYMALSRGAFQARPGPSARAARPEDLPFLLKLNRAFQLEYFGRFTDAEEEMGRMALERMADSGITVAELEGRIVAKAEILVRTGRMAAVGGVYTRPGQRGQGFSGACMSLLCEQVLRKREAVCLNVAVKNLPALRLYRGLGFREVCDYLMVLFPS